MVKPPGEDCFRKSFWPLLLALSSQVNIPLYHYWSDKDRGFYALYILHFQIDKSREREVARVAQLLSLKLEIVTQCARRVGESCVRKTMSVAVCCLL